MVWYKGTSEDRVQTMTCCKYQVKMRSDREEGSQKQERKEKGGKVEHSHERKSTGLIPVTAHNLLTHPYERH